MSQGRHLRREKPVDYLERGLWCFATPCAGGLKGDALFYVVRTFVPLDEKSPLVVRPRGFLGRGF